jgi:hypothetical protein
MSDAVDLPPPPSDTPNLDEWAKGEYEKYVLMLLKPSTNVSSKWNMPEVRKAIDMDTFIIGATFYVEDSSNDEILFMAADESNTVSHRVRIAVGHDDRLSVMSIRFYDYEEIGSLDFRTLMSPFLKRKMWLTEDDVRAQIPQHLMNMFEQCTDMRLADDNATKHYHLSLDAWVQNAQWYEQHNITHLDNVVDAFKRTISVFLTPVAFHARYWELMRDSLLEPQRMVTVGGATWHMYPPDSFSGSVNLESPTVFVIPQYNKELRKYAYVTSANKESGQHAYRRFDLGVGDKVLAVASFPTKDSMVAEIDDLIRKHGRVAMVYEADMARLRGALVRELTSLVIPLVNRKNSKPFYSISWDQYSDGFSLKRNASIK